MESCNKLYEGVIYIVRNGIRAICRALSETLNKITSLLDNNTTRPKIGSEDAYKGILCEWKKIYYKRVLKKGREK